MERSSAPVDASEALAAADAEIDNLREKNRAAEEANADIRRKLDAPAKSNVDEGPHHHRPKR